PAMASDSLSDVVSKLHDIEAVKFGEFKLKSGLISPVYFDLRVIVSHPELMRTISQLIFAACSDLKFDYVCGVPYTALPIATCISVDRGIPMLMRRKETKDYGTKKILEGKFDRGQSCLIIEDVVTSGSSVLETAEILRREGLRVAGVGVLLDREQGAAENLRRAGLPLRCVLRLTQLLRQLETSKSVSASFCVTVRTFVLENQVTIQTNDNDREATGDAAEAPSLSRLSARCRMPFEQRAEVATQPQARRLLALMAEKETNLCVAADRTLGRDVLALAEQVGPHICVLKVHCDILDDFSPDFVSRLRDLAKRHNFLIMEDRKLADIGHVTRLQATGGQFRIADWADLVTAHALPGPGLLSGLEGAHGMAAVLVAEMSSEGSPINEEYSAAALAMAETHGHLVAGLVCQSDLATDPGLLQFTPGVSFSGGASDGLGQRYREPGHVVGRGGCDVIIVGRGVAEASDPRSAAESYRQAAFRAYRERLKTE
ncbi:hypothetical protein BOX15_Mlig018512g3, partial [Macrostomum lignano]